MYRFRPVQVDTVDEPFGPLSWEWVRSERRWSECRYGYEFLAEWLLRFAEKLARSKGWIVSKHPTRETFTFRPEDLAAEECVQKQMLAILNAGKEPEAVLVGGPQWREILAGVAPYHPHRIGGFRFEHTIRGVIEYQGVPVVVLPEIDGIVVVPEGTLRRAR